MSIIQSEDFIPNGYWTRKGTIDYYQLFDYLTVVGRCREAIDDNIIIHINDTHAIHVTL
jgi:hypothetical protein